MAFVEIGGVRLHYLEAGSGRPIVCFHSTPASARFYQPQLDFFADRYRVLAFDLRGHGDSDKPPGAYRVAEFLQDYRDIFDAFGLEDFVLVGCSVGGIVAQLYALEHAQRLRGLVLIGAPCSRRGRDVAGFHRAVQQHGWEHVVRGLVNKQLHRNTVPDVRELAVHEFLKTPLHVRAAEEEALLADVHHTERLPAIATPTLLVAGEDEDHEIAEQMALMSLRIPDAEWHILPGAAHIANFEQPARFNAVLDRFLQKIRYD